MIIFSIPGSQLFDSSIDIVLTFEFGHDVMILKMAIFDKVDYIEIELALLTVIQFNVCPSQSISNCR